MIIIACVKLNRAVWLHRSRYDYTARGMIDYTARMWSSAVKMALQATHEATASLASVYC